MLADFGAEVIKIEHPLRFDHSRTLPPIANQQVLVPGQTAAAVSSNANLSGIFHNHNRSKLSVTIDLDDEVDFARFESLVKVSDVVVESYSPKVFDDRGITFDFLRSLNPRIILVRCSGLGHTGKDFLHKTAGPINQALTGLTYLSGQPRLEPAGWGFSLLDQTGAFYVTMAVLQALIQRQRTGTGQYVDISIVEAGAGMLGPVLLDYQVNGTLPIPPANNGLPPVGAPENLYPCAGEDRWCAISVLHDAEWRALCDAIGRPDLADDSQFSTAMDRLRHHEELDEVISEWTRGRRAEDVFQLLQQAGVAAGVVQDGSDLARDPQLRERNAFPRISHPAIADAMVEGVAVKLSRTPGGPRHHGPMLGEHNDYVFNELVPSLLASGAIR